MAMHPTQKSCLSCGQLFSTQGPRSVYCSIECKLLAKLALVKCEPADCWEWFGASVNGYGKISHGAQQELAHRVSYRVFHGPIEAGLVVCHTCDNKPCINPSHFFLGTLADNNRDCITKNRHVVGRIGEDHAGAKLCASDVLEIRDILHAGVMKQKDIAAAYGITPSNLCHIKTRKLWSHI